MTDRQLHLETPRATIAVKPDFVETVSAASAIWFTTQPGRFGDTSALALATATANTAAGALAFLGRCRSEAAANGRRAWLQSFGSDA
jgi:hypothetical protein